MQCKGNAMMLVDPDPKTTAVKKSELLCFRQNDVTAKDDGASFTALGVLAAEASKSLIGEKGDDEARKAEQERREHGTDAEDKEHKEKGGSVFTGEISHDARGVTLPDTKAAAAAATTEQLGTTPKSMRADGCLTKTKDGSSARGGLIRSTTATMILAQTASIGADERATGTRVLGDLAGDLPKAGDLVTSTGVPTHLNMRQWKLVDCDEQGIWNVAPVNDGSENTPGGNTGATTIPFASKFLRLFHRSPTVKAQPQPSGVVVPTTHLEVAAWTTKDGTSIDKFAINTPLFPKKMVVAANRKDIDIFASTFGPVIDYEFYPTMPVGLDVNDPAPSIGPVPRSESFKVGETVLIHGLDLPRGFNDKQGLLLAHVGGDDDRWVVLVKTSRKRPALQVAFPSGNLAHSFSPVHLKALGPQPMPAWLKAARAEMNKDQLDPVAPPFVPQQEEKVKVPCAASTPTQQREQLAQIMINMSKDVSIPNIVPGLEKDTVLVVDKINHIIRSINLVSGKETLVAAV